MRGKPALKIGAAVSVILATLRLTQVHVNAQTTRRVPADFPTIQQAINAATPGDTVLVAAGTYLENINFLGKAIKVESNAGPGGAIIDGNQANSVVTFASGETMASMLRGFTLRNGSTSASGGGVRIQNSSPTIEENIIISNRACTGAGVAVSSGSPFIQGNTIAGNAQSTGCSSGRGGGISIDGNGATQIVDNLIANNLMVNGDGGGIALLAAGTPTIRGNVIQGNIATGPSSCAAGGGISMVNMSDALVVQNLIIDNSAECGGGIYWDVPSGARGPLVVNNTIVGNDSPQGSGIFADGFDAQAQLFNNIIIAEAGQTAVFCEGSRDVNPPVFRSNDILSPSGSAYGGTCTNQTGLNGNISADPLFVDQGNGDYHVRRGSPAIDAGNNTPPGFSTTDIDGETRILDGSGDQIAVVDMGIDEIAPPSPVPPPPPLVGPDLTGSWQNASEKCKVVEGGFKCKIKGKFLVRSQGTQDAPSSRIRFYLSSDAIFDDSDFLLRETDVRSLSVGRAKSKKLKVQLFTTNTFAGQFVIAVVDANNALAEINEVNNSLAIGPLF